MYTGSPAGPHAPGFPDVDDMVPHLTTSLTGPLQEIERVVLAKRVEIER